MDSVDSVDSGPDDTVLVVANPDAMTDSTTLVMGSDGGKASLGMPAGIGASVAVAAAAAAAAASASASGGSIDLTSSDAIDTMMPNGISSLM